MFLVRLFHSILIICSYDEKDSFVLTILFTAAIGLIPIAILPIFSIFLYNLQTKSVNTILLDALLAFAAGGLLGILIDNLRIARLRFMLFPFAIYLIIVLPYSLLLLSSIHL